MKKTTKLLVLIMTVALVFACSAFFAYAAEDEETIFEDVVVWTDVNFESMADDYKFDADKNFGSPGFGGVVIYCTSYLTHGYRGGSIESLVAEDGTKSLVYYSTGKTSTVDPYVSDYIGNAPTKTGSTHSLSNYSYFSLDFDMKSPTKFYDDSTNKSSLNFQAWFYYMNASGASKNVNKGFATFATNSDGKTVMTVNGKTYTLNDSDVWQHYTLLLKIGESIDGMGNIVPKVDGYFFVDGQFIAELPALFNPGYNEYFINAESGEPDTSLTVFREIRINIPSQGSEKSVGVESVAVDNWKVKSFSNFYKYKSEIDDVVSGYIDLVDWSEGTFTRDYEYPFGNLVATVLNENGKAIGYYDNAEEAFAATEDGYTVKIHDNVSGVYVSKNVTVDATEDAEGNKQTTPYTFDFISDKYSAVLVDGIYTLKRTQNSTVKYFWEMPSAKDTPSNGQLFKITSSVLGAVPVYPDAIDEFFFVTEEDGIDVPAGVYRFEGWSYDNDNTVDELLPVTEADLESATGAWCALYPVFTYCDVKVTKGNGRVYYCSFDDIAEEAAASAGLTFSLVKDTVSENTITFAKAATFDLNGYSYNYVGSGTAFDVPAGALLTVKSTAEGGKLFTAANVSGAVKSLGVAKIAGNLTFEGENLAVYTSQLFSAAADATATVTVNGGTYYRTVDDGVALIPADGSSSLTIEAENAVFVSNTAEANIVKFISSGDTTAEFVGCDFIALNDSAAIINNSEDSALTFEACYIDAKISHLEGETVLGYETVYSVIEGDASTSRNCKLFGIPETLAVASKKVSIALNTFAIDGEGLADSSYVLPEATEQQMKFAGIVGGSTVEGGVTVTNCVKVEWLAPDGELIRTDIAYPGTTTALVPPEYTYVWTAEKGGDGWRNMIISNWTNAANEVNKFFISADVAAGTTVTYNGIAPEADSADALFNAAPTKILWNVSFGNKVVYSFYLPKEEAVNITSFTFGGEEKFVAANTVKIGEQDYYLCTVEVEVYDAHVMSTATVSYTIAGVDYEYEFVGMNALGYAEAAIEGELLTDEEEVYILNYIRYAQKVNAKNTPSPLYEIFFAEHPAPEYITEYPDADLNNPAETVENEAQRLMSYVKDISFTIGANGKLTFTVKMKTGTEVKAETGVTTLFTNFYIYDSDATTELVKVKGAVTELTVSDIEISDLGKSFYIGAKANKKDLAKAEFNLAAYINRVLAADANADVEDLEAAYALAVSYKEDFTFENATLK